MNCLTSLFNGLIVSGTCFTAKSTNDSFTLEIWNSPPLVNALINDVVNFYSMTEDAGPYYMTFQRIDRGLKIIVYENEL